MHGTHKHDPIYAYQLNPIDFWAGWTKAKKAVRPVHFGPGEFIEAELDLIDPEVWERQWNLAQAAAAKVGWEGDVRGEPYVIGLPEDGAISGGGGRFIIGWKQDNNGTTFVVSPVRLPWLEEENHGYKNHIKFEAPTF